MLELPRTKSCSIHPGCWDKRRISLQGIFLDTLLLALNKPACSSVCTEVIAPHPPLLYALSGGIRLATALSLWSPALRVQARPSVRGRNFPFVFLPPPESIYFHNTPIDEELYWLSNFIFLVYSESWPSYLYQLSQNVAMEGTRGI